MESLPQPFAAPSGWRRHGRRLAVLVVGLVLIATGVALLVLPGPGVLVIFAGLAVLSTEFSAAQRAKRWLGRKAKRAYGRMRGGAHHGQPPSEGGDPTSPLVPPTY
ncbi:hypothetical protein BH24ACT14_BH24ACT14_11880 [soil metagenome]